MSYLPFSESLALFDCEYYKQIDGVAMGSSLGPTLPIFFLFIMNKFGSKIVLVDLNLSFVKDMLITPSCYFNQEIILKNSDATLIANILTLSLHLRYNKAILYRFSILKSEGLTIVFLQVFIVS